MRVERGTRTTTSHCRRRQQHSRRRILPPLGSKGFHPMSRYYPKPHRNLDIIVSSMPCKFMEMEIPSPLWRTILRTRPCTWQPHRWHCPVLVGRDTTSNPRITTIIPTIPTRPPNCSSIPRSITRCTRPWRDIPKHRHKCSIPSTKQCTVAFHLIPLHPSLWWTPNQRRQDTFLRTRIARRTGPSIQSYHPHCTLPQHLRTNAEWKPYCHWRDMWRPSLLQECGCTNVEDSSKPIILCKGCCVGPFIPPEFPMVPSHRL